MDNDEPTTNKENISTIRNTDQLDGILNDQDHIYIDNSRAGPTALCPFSCQVTLTREPDPWQTLDRETSLQKQPHPFFQPQTTRKRNWRKERKKGRQKKKGSITETGEEDQQVKIFNLSKRTLNPYELSLLRKGLSFCPSKDTDPFELFIDLHRVTNTETTLYEGKTNQPQKCYQARRLTRFLEGKHKEITTKSSYYP